MSNHHDDRSTLSAPPLGRWGPLADRTLPWPHRLVALQGWRDEEILAVLRAGPAVRLAPALCAAGSLAVVVTRSPLLTVVLAASATVGAATGRHPVEWLHRAWARPRGRPTLPPARAGRRFACALAGTWLAVVGGADAAGRAGLATALGLALAAAAAVFTATGLCLPSALLTAVAGADRAKGATLGAVVTVGSRRRDRRPRGL